MMMTPFRKGKGKQLQIYVPGRPGQRPVQRSTGTSNATIAGKMRRLVRRLKQDHEWALLDAARERRGFLERIFIADAEHSLEELRASLKSVDVVTHVDAWIAEQRMQKGDETRTPEEYERQVRALLGASFPSHKLTRSWLKKALGALTVSTGTRRKYLYACKSFIAYLVDEGVLPADPIGKIKAPKKNRARERWVTEAVDQAIVATANAKYRGLFAFVKATGADVSVAIARTFPRDLDLARGRVRLHGTKTDRRAVHEALIEAWALPILAEYLRFASPATPLFGTLTRFGAQKHHSVCCRQAGVEDYTLKDARHSVAVRMRFKGYSFEEIAEQLGNSVEQVVRVYSRFKPTLENKEMRDAHA